MENDLVFGLKPARIKIDRHENNQTCEKFSLSITIDNLTFRTAWFFGDDDTIERLVERISERVSGKIEVEK